ncbi:DUF1491 domain-containing protein [Hyphomicrobium methylovorum]|uniref:DUF1491 family protein n=1 Tax=Hyphomicrobium methylovorum TaxID=84 RepID=UPI0015E66D26|nr:DUF1491 family protein [Hyphomicrobium methylovorum]MBA2124691.1 DUF1491 domain-containing protein [Hyphomicrobium methylovorum]
MRLKSEFWVKAYLRRCTVSGASGVVVRHGDDDAGAIFIKVVRADRMVAVYSPAPAGMDEADRGRRWVVCFSEEFVTDDKAEAMLTREADFDRDVWVVEIDDRDGRHFLGDELLE